MTPTPDQEDRDYPFTVQNTDEQLAARKAESTNFWAERGTDNPKFTCDECAQRTRCDLAYDFYNTDGDCLADK